jgi:hypothetical protein
MSLRAAGRAVPTFRHLPEAVIQSALEESFQRDPVTARRLTLLTLLSRESHQTQASLIYRTEARLGRGSFGKAAGLVFRRDMQAVRAILAAGGQSLRYSRKVGHTGYYIEGRPGLAPEVRRAIHGAADEIDPHQIAVFARLTPGQRLRLAARLTEDLLAIAVRQLQHEQPELPGLEAQREVLYRAYQLPG